jgi:hypothetical protein
MIAFFSCSSITQLFDLYEPVVGYFFFRPEAASYRLYREFTYSAASPGF